MEKSSFFNSINKDRRYKAEDWAAYFSSFIGNGVFPVPSTGLQVIAGSGMTVIIRAGKAWINGYFYENDSELILTLPTADGVLKRYDRIVLRWDLTSRAITARVKSSMPASNPTPPPLQRDADAYEIALADKIVNAGETSFSQSSITDQRWNTALCGVVAGVVQQIDPSSITAQFDQFFAEYKPLIEYDYNTYTANIAAFYELYKQYVVDNYDQYTGDIDYYYNLYKQNALNQYTAYVTYLTGYKDDSAAAYEAFMLWLETFKITGTGDFQAWFDAIKGILDTDAAGNLLLLIQELQAKTPTATIGTIEHSLKKYPACTLYKVDYAAGIGGAGVGGAGGGNLFTIPAEFEIDGFERVTVKTIAEFAANTEIHKISEDMYGFAAPDSITSLLLILR